MSPIGDILPTSQGAARSATPAAANRTLNPVAAAVAACAAVCASAQEAIHILIQRDSVGRSVPVPISSSHFTQAPPVDAAGAVQKPELHERRRQCAAGLYEMLRRRNSQKSLTQTQALALVKEFGIALVERAIRVIARRADLYNPAGFLRVWLRGERLRAALEGKMPPPAPSTKSRSTPRLSEAAEAAAQAAWIEKLRNSPYAAFYANAADFGR
ncbi:hypothetical protein HC928_11180 [bacterium]|nr:hypothetical protein [bacterium]